MPQITSGFLPNQEISGNFILTKIQGTIGEIRKKLQNKWKIRVFFLSKAKSKIYICWLNRKSLSLCDTYSNFSFDLL